MTERCAAQREPLPSPPAAGAAIRVLQASAEIFPLLKTGGLADVAGALPAALGAAGCDVRVLLPGFPAIRGGLRDAARIAQFTLPWGETVGVLRGDLPAVGGGDGRAVRAYVLHAPGLYDRPGNPYEDGMRRPYADNHRRFAALGWGAAHLARGLDPDWSPHLVHGHDWHAGLACACIKLTAGRQVPCVFTVHNLAYQGIFPADHFGDLGLPPGAFGIHGVEFHGQVSFMKAGLFYADKITTVSPTYSREIQTPEQGFGLDGLLRSRRGDLTGILNGVDTAVWNPATDPLIPRRYSAAQIAGKSYCKAALQAEAGLRVTKDAPLFTVVSRLTEQKGLNLVVSGVDALVDAGGQLLVLGSGDPALEAAFSHAAQRHPGAVALRVGYDEEFAHRIFAGGDVTLVPSRFEPCGLTQMYGLLYGSLPLVRAVGGLADTVVDADLATLADGTATGIVFSRFDEADYRHALRRALALYRQPRAWAQVRHTGMQQNFSWAQAAQRYRAVYLAALPGFSSAPT
jgi:starch synthase